MSENWHACQEPGQLLHVVHLPLVGPAALVYLSDLATDPPMNEPDEWLTRQPHRENAASAQYDELL